MNGYKKVVTGQRFMITSDAFCDWSKGTIVTVLEANRVVVVMRRDGILDVKFTLPTSTFRAMFQEAK